MRFVSSLPWIALSLLSGCSFDFGPFGQAGQGGTGGTGTTGVMTTSAPSTGVGPSTTGPTSSSNGTGPATTSTSSGPTTTATSSTSGTGGGAPSLPPCGGLVDNFNQPTTNVWLVDQDIAFDNQQVTATTNSDKKAGLTLSAKQTFTECYASIKLVNFGTNSTGLGVFDGTNFKQANYDASAGKASIFPPPMTGTSANPDYLGIAFHGMNVTFLFAEANGVWQTIGATPRDSWLDGQGGTQIYFGNFGNNGSSAVFDDFNVKTIALSDL